MKPWQWGGSVAALAAVLVALEGWPALREVAASREWRPVAASVEGGKLDGLQVAVAAQIAAIAELRPERAAVLVRLDLQVTPEARASWTDCRVSLQSPAGEIWMPLTSASADGAIKAISPDRRNHGACRLYSTSEQEGIEAVQADQLFLLPSDRLQGLRLHVSGLGTRPRALSFELTPEVRRLP